MHSLTSNFSQKVKKCIYLREVIIFSKVIILGEHRRLPYTSENTMIREQFQTKLNSKSQFGAVVVLCALVFHQVAVFAIPF